jgi:hypothetical protein
MQLVIMSSVSDRVVVQMVHSTADLPHIISRLIPSILEATDAEVDLWTLDYSSDLKPSLPDRIDRVTLTTLSRTGNKPTGFAANHNRMFQSRNTCEDFVILNPDCILAPGAIDQLCSTKARIDRAGIVEGRQWPFEHPKEVDPLTFETPWASGAFCLIDGNFYREAKGMDEGFFMYLEDVDLSWRAWLSDYTVVYEPKSVVAHFSGGQFVRPDVVSSEEYFGLRNFLRLAYKFFGENGEDLALKFIQEEENLKDVEAVLHDFRTKIKPTLTPPHKQVSHPRLKILGVNRFHLVRLRLVPQ